MPGRQRSPGPGAGVKALVHQLRGRTTEVDWGTWKSGKMSRVKLKADLGYYKLELAGETVHKIDVDTMVRIIDGEDQLAEMREALGIQEREGVRPGREEGRT